MMMMLKRLNPMFFSVAYLVVLLHELAMSFEYVDNVMCLLGIFATSESADH